MNRLYILICFLFISSIMFSSNNDISYETYPGATIIVGKKYNNGKWCKWPHNIEAINRTSSDLWFIITYRRCTVKLISKSNQLSKNNCSETVTVTKLVPRNTRIKELLEFGRDEYGRDKDPFPDLKKIGNLEWGFDIVDFKAKYVD